MPLLAVIIMAGAVVGAPAASCDGNTQEMEVCLGERLTRHEANLARYVAAARKRLGEAGAKASDGATARALSGFDAAEAAWRTYRDAECGAVYDYWSAGTIRGLKSLKCRMILTQRHTTTIWSEWLRYEDDTPPILPEPPQATFP